MNRVHLVTRDKWLTPEGPGHYLRETYDHIRTWEEGEYRLEMYDTHRTYGRFGKSRLAYQFYHGDTLVFEGDEYYPSPMHSIDGDKSVAGLLSFLALKPGDTDKEYFNDYTAGQLAWAQLHGENLSLFACELEEAAA